MSLALKDAQIRNTRALPASASATVDGAALDLGHGSFGDFVAQAEFKLSAPAVNATMAPDTRTFTYSIIHSDNADLSSPLVLYSSVIVQTGAGGAGGTGSQVIIGRSGSGIVAAGRRFAETQGIDGGPAGGGGAWIVRAGRTARPAGGEM